MRREISRIVISTLGLCLIPVLAFSDPGANLSVPPGYSTATRYPVLYLLHGPLP